MKKERNRFGIVKGLPKSVYIKGTFEAVAIGCAVVAGVAWFNMIVSTLVMLLEV